MVTPLPPGPALLTPPPSLFLTLLQGGGGGAGQAARAVPRAATHAEREALAESLRSLVLADLCSGAAVVWPAAVPGPAVPRRPWQTPRP